MQLRDLVVRSRGEENDRLCSVHEEEFHMAKLLRVTGKGDISCHFRELCCAIKGRCAVLERTDQTAWAGSEVRYRRIQGRGDEIGGLFTVTLP